MGVIKDRHGTYYAQQRVPETLQAAVARVLGSEKPRQVFLKKSLGTKVLKEASVRAKIIQVGFDQVLKRASDLTAPRNVLPNKRQSLNSAEIVRMAEAFLGQLLAEDEERRFGGRASTVRAVEWIKRNDEPNFVLPYPIESVPEFGVTSEQLADNRQQNTEALTFARELLAMGDINAVEDQIAMLLDKFQIDLDRKSASYRELGTAVLSAYVRACEAISKRDAGEPVPTPEVLNRLSVNSGTIEDAFEGWKKERERPEGTVHEYGRAVAMFVQLHGNIPLLGIKRSHARMFREALQLVPRFRKGALLKASLPELSDYGRTHPAEQKVTPGTVNKQIGAVQAIAGWGRHNGLVPEDAPWSDPFEEMRLEEEQSQRAPFDVRDLQTIFNTPLFTAHELPVGAKGDAGIWLPLLALFAGARQAEYAGLRVSDIREDEETGIPFMWFTRDAKAGRRLKTRSSERVVPVHPQLIKLGFLKYVETRRKAGDRAWLFPTVAPDQKGALRAWAKWWGRHLRDHVGVRDTNKVFHSFRHGFQDALRQATPDEELRDALAGRSSGKSVSRRYGAKAMVERWGVKALKEAIDKISYPGLDLSRVKIKSEKGRRAPLTGKKTKLP